MSDSPTSGSKQVSILVGDYKEEKALKSMTNSVLEEFMC